MDGYEVKIVMDQVHISPKMQEEITMNIQKRMEHGTKNTNVWNWRKMATAAAVFALAAGGVSLPVRAFVTNVVQERMKSVPKEEVKGLNDMAQSQNDIQADGFSRAYSDNEKERNKALWEAYKNGTFPKKAIAQVNSAKEAQEGTLCYIKATGVFNLPASEMTDEEMLEIIDFQNKMSYAVSQGSAAQEVRAKEQAKTARIEKIVQDANGLSGEEAVEIARRQLKADFGDAADELELMTDSSGNGATLCDTAQEGYEQIDSKANVVYDIGFGNPDTRYTCGYIIDAVDGSILRTYK